MFSCYLRLITLFFHPRYFQATKSKLRRSIFGSLVTWVGPNRNKTSKFYINEEQYSKTLFPPFTSGLGYAITGNRP